MNSTHSSESSLSSIQSKTSSGSNTNSMDSFSNVLSPISRQMNIIRKDQYQTKQGIVEQKVAHLKSLYDILKDMSKIAPNSRTKKIADEMIDDSTHILKYYGIKLKVIRENTMSSPYEFLAVTNIETLAYALVSIVSMVSEFPFSFVTKLGIPEFIICNEVLVRDEKYKASLKTKLLSGIFMVDTIYFNHFYEHLSKIFLHYLLKKTGFKKEWEQFLATIADYFKFEEKNALEDLSNTWDMFTRIRRGQFIQKDELKTLKLDKLAYMLKLFDNEGFEAPEPKMPPPVKKASLRAVPVTRGF